MDSLNDSSGCGHCSKAPGGPNRGEVTRHHVLTGSADLGCDYSCFPDWADAARAGFRGEGVSGIARGCRRHHTPRATSCTPYPYAARAIRVRATTPAATPTQPYTPGRSFRKNTESTTTKTD